MTAEQLRTISEMGIIPPQQLLPVLQQTGLPSNTSHVRFAQKFMK